MHAIEPACSLQMGSHLSQYIHHHSHLMAAQWTAENWSHKPGVPATESVTLRLGSLCRKAGKKLMKTFDKCGPHAHMPTAVSRGLASLAFTPLTEPVSLQAECAV